MPKVKICGLVCSHDVEIVNEYKPDYIGFVFAQSKRKISPEQAALLKKALSADIAAVGVFINEPIMNITALVKSGTIDVVQLHGNEDEEYIRELKLHTGDTPLIDAVAGGGVLTAPCIADFMLFDAPEPGSGKTFDWNTIPQTSKPFFLAGGLNPDNVADAVAVVKPFAVDVSSGVELNGRKNADLVANFVANARNAR
jgi:phosphoribosylanthranilate isomerase